MSSIRRLSAAWILFAASPLLAALERPVSPDEAPRADAFVLRELAAGKETVDVLIGVRDGVPSPRVLPQRADPAGEPERRLRRFAAQRAIARSLPRQLEVRRQYGSFSVMAGRVTREGLLSLANRDDVAWITVDGKRHMHLSTPQSAQVLIHSDQTNAIGFTGAGQAVAVLDTGVDYTHPDLGGGPFPNAKVVGGADLGDNDADPMDCEGHGTSVAAVAAGPTGVAPDAAIVALKVVKGAQCDEADDSDILAAIDWAVDHQGEFHIGVINLSFGGSPTDGLAHGYCDALYPQYIQSIDAANGAGIAFVSSSGNDGLDNAVSAPACVSNALSVGAVYAEPHESVGWLDDSGGTQCEDTSVQPDTIICFSNSATSLSLLAPGAFWLVAVKGGGSDFFHGTSASSPAVAGAVALMHQAHPEMSPSAIGSLLKATGRPLSDSRNGVLTPRIDTLAAAQQLPSGFAPFDGTVVPIPDGLDSASVTATVSGFAGTLASVEAVVEITHDDPRQLRITLTGPDGTTVLLHDHTGSLHHPISGTYGKTLASAQSLGAFQGKPANGVWTLTVTDDQQFTSGSIRNFAMRMVAGQPAGAIPAGADTEVLPIVGRVQGTKFFLSDVRILNPQATEQTLSLFYVAQGLNGSQAVTTQRTIAPGQVLALNDVVGSEFGYADSIGELTLLGADTRFITTSRAYTQGPNGTFGLFVPAFRADSSIGPGEQASANGLAKNAQFHTNAGFTEVSGAPVSVKMDVFGASGTLLASTTRSAPANGNLLVTDIIGDRGLGTTNNFRIDYTVVSATGRVIPYATYVDDVTGDGVFEAAVDPALSADDIIIAQASHATGANGDFFKTNLNVTNLGSAAATVTVSLLPRTLTGTPATPRVYVIAPGATLERLDVLASEFGLADPSAAGLRIHPNAPARLRVFSRTYVEKFGGTFGFSIPGIAASEAFGWNGCNGGPPCPAQARVIHLDQTSSAQGYRSNIGFAEVGGADARIHVTIRDQMGTAFVENIYTVPANGSFQIGVGQILNGNSASNIYVEFGMDAETAGRILAYGVSVDNTSGDAIYIPAETPLP